MVIVFVDGKNPEDVYESCLTFDPSCMKSHFNHIFALVSYDHIKSEYRCLHVSGPSCCTRRAVTFRVQSAVGSNPTLSLFKRVVVLGVVELFGLSLP